MPDRLDPASDAPPISSEQAAWREGYAAGLGLAAMLFEQEADAADRALSVIVEPPRSFLRVTESLHVVARALRKNADA